MKDNCENASRVNVPIANCDQEAWVMSRIYSVIRMAGVLRDNRKVDADDPLYKSAIDGLVNGAAYEIVRTLGMEPEYTNIKNPYSSQNITNKING